MPSRNASSVEQSLNPLLALAPPPPSQARPHHVGVTSPTSPRRRDHIPQPPAITTSLSGLQFQGAGLASAGPTPSTSLSSPFSHANTTPYTPYAPSPGGALRGTSPMASRQSGGYTTAYNPREWGPVAASPVVGVAALSQLHQRNGQSRLLQPSDETAAPPPYSPRRQEPLSRPGSSLVISPAETTSPQSQYNTPVSAIGTPLTDVTYDGRLNRSRPASMIYSAESPNPLWSSALPPPPPSANRTARSASSAPATRADGLTLTSSTAGRGTQFVTGSSTTQQDQRATPYSDGQIINLEAPLVPPASKRAVSASAIGTGGVSSRTNSRSGSRSPTRQTTWDPGMPLPGPPPGPPPSSSRSQSASARVDMFPRQMSGQAIRPKGRQPPQMGTSLGPVPPTPAGWVDASGPETDSVTDTIKTGSSFTFSPVDITSSATPSSTHSDAADTFFRANGTRDLSAKGIRERRSESRSARENHRGEVDASPNIHPWADPVGDVTPADLTLPLGGTGLSRRRTITKSTPRTPRSSRSATMEDQLPTDSRVNSAGSSSRTTPRLDSARHQLSLDGLIQTPPFSPGDTHSPRLARTPNVLPPKSLPTPPLQHGRSPITLSIPPSNPQMRPISHILHIPNEANGIPAPLSPRRLSSIRPNPARNNHPDHDTFVRDCLDRTRTFLEREHHAGNDEDRLRIFSEYVLAESRIRRRRYAPAFASFDARQTRERLFEVNLHAPRRSSGLQETSIASPVEPPSPHPRNQLPQQPWEPVRPDQGRPDTMWWSGYQPALSPIASLSMNEEQSSRGRAPSRWWESQTGSENAAENGGGVRRVERSKRESKYMGLPLREAQLAMEGEDPSDPGPSQYIYGPNEYPPDKSGWHESEPSTAPAMPPPPPSPRAAIDVSRLVTLPPPYPRHYPAVQNQHPDLLSYRTLVRTVSDTTEPTSRRKRYTSSIEALQKDSQCRIAENRRNFRINIQAQIQEGSISFAEAAEAEAALKSEEHAAEKTRVQAEFDSFQDVVLNPLHDLLNNRISQLSHHLDELRGKLLHDAQLHNPNETQSAGDERPELLEQLTQLKWLFEAREQLHRDLFHLLTERNEKYQAIVTLPYQQQQQQSSSSSGGGGGGGTNNKAAKIRDTAAFFSRDTQHRTIAFENGLLLRHQRFLAVIEDNVLRGVEAQLSAFWDIAPALLAICQKIPEVREPDLLVAATEERVGSGTGRDGGGGGGGYWRGIQIPREEIEENPSYRDFPMQYLYTLLVHAERSTYQFIESQVNLLCLLHEARAGVMAAEVRCWEVQRLADGPSGTGTGTGSGTGIGTGAGTGIGSGSPNRNGNGIIAGDSATSTSTLTPAPTPAPASVGMGENSGPGALVLQRYQEEVKREAAERREREERALTADLKDRVATVEGQWTEALGSAIVGTRERVRGWLVEEGGWDGEVCEVVE